MQLCRIPEFELKRIRESEKALCNPYLFAGIAANIAKFNALYLIGRSCSGKTIALRDSFADIIAWLYTQIMKNPNELVDDEICDAFICSGSDYIPVSSVLQFFLGKRKPISSIGSFELAISKAIETARDKRRSGVVGRVYLLAEGKKLEGIYLADLLRRTAEENFSEITIILDNEKEIGELAWQFFNYGWEAAECDGHNFRAIDDSLRNLRDKNPKNKPQVLVCYTKNSKEGGYAELARKFKIKIDSLAHFAGLGKMVFESV